jgi:hypothetical protein
MACHIHADHAKPKIASSPAPMTVSSPLDTCSRILHAQTSFSPRKLSFCRLWHLYNRLPENIESPTDLANLALNAQELGEHKTRCSHVLGPAKSR